MVAPRTDYEEEFFDGMTIPKLAQLFRMERRTVQEKLRGVRPTSERRGAPVYHVADAAPYLVDPVVDIQKYLQELTPSELPPQLQQTFWAAQNSKLKFMEASKDLWRTTAVMELLAAVFSSISQSFRLIEDEVQSKDELSPKQRQIIRKMMDGSIIMARKRLVDDFEVYSGVRDKEALTEFNLDDTAGEEE